MTWFALGALFLWSVAGAFLVPVLWRAVTQPSEKAAALGVWLAVALGAGAVYGVVGRPQAIGYKDSVVESTRPRDVGEALAGVNGPSAEQVEGMVARLAARLETQPDDVQGWRMLARSYETLGRFEPAAQAYRKILALGEADADVLTNYAVVLGMTQNQTLVGEPERLLDRALQLSPHHIQALALSGSAALERGDNAKAVARWRELLQLIPADDESRKTIEDNIHKAERQGQRKPF